MFVNGSLTDLLNHSISVDKTCHPFAICKIYNDTIYDDGDSFDFEYEFCLRFYCEIPDDVISYDRSKGYNVYFRRNMSLDLYAAIDPLLCDVVKLINGYNAQHPHSIIYNESDHDLFYGVVSYISKYAHYVSRAKYKQASLHLLKIK